MDPSARQKLLFRRQYFYGPEALDYPGWNNINMPDGAKLSVHPDLAVIEVNEAGFHFVLLGYMLDPDHPGWNNQQILVNICQVSSNTEDVIASLDNLGGRYILFIYHQDDRIVVNDAGGLRPVYFFKDKQDRLWLAAQPGLLSDRFGFSYTDEAISFLNSETILKYREPWWPADSSPFAEVKHLLPNHLLNLADASTRRFWPREQIQHYSLDEGVEKAAGILQKLLLAANNRFELAMALTGGYDSRIIFAAGKDILKDLHVYSMIYHRLTQSSPDITISGDIARFAGVEHQVFACDSPMDDDFEYLYTHNLEKSYQSYGNIVYGRYLNLDQKYVVIKSVVNEIARCFYYRNGVYPYQVTTDLLCKVSKLGEHPFVHWNFENWLKDARPVEKLGYKILDFFYWENRNANWQAMSQLEFDLTHEEWTPFNHRNLLSTMLGVDFKYRHMPRNIFQRELVKRSWPELDQFPYNPRGKVIKKPFYEGPWMTLGRWVKYHLIKRK